MKGADEYAGLFNTGQYGCLYIVSSCHARGRTFRIQILPKGEMAIKNGNSNLCLNADAVEVYGIISGQPGWTEEYGWIHKGPWVEDFERLATSFRMEREAEAERSMAREETAERERKKREKRLLDAYGGIGEVTHA